MITIEAKDFLTDPDEIRVLQEMQHEMSKVGPLYEIGPSHPCILFFIREVARLRKAIHNPEIGYLTHCSNCDGDGEITDEYNHEARICWNCRGTGKIPTERGEELMEFLKWNKELY